MKPVRNNIRMAAANRGRTWSPAALALAVSMLVAQPQIAWPDILNSATASATYNSAPVISTPSSAAVPVIAAAPAMTMAKSGILNDSDGIAGLTAGDTVSYAVTATNTGNVSIGSLSLNDPLVALAYTSGDGGTAGVLDVAETWTYTGTYTITQSDLDGNGGGDGDLDNTVTASGTAGTLAVQATGDAAVALNAAPSLQVSKTADDTTDAIAGQIITYTYVVSNAGNQTVTNISLNDVHNGSGPAPAPGNEALSADTRTAGDSTDATANDGVWNVLAPGDSITFTASYTVTQSDVDTLQ
jgi:hypothetical protein